MTGLEKITEKIMLEAQDNCDRIIENANEQVKDILAQARLQANTQSDEIIANAEAEAEKKVAVAKSSAESITRNRYLEIRNAILNDIISAAYLKIDKLSDDEYFSLIRKLLIKHMQTGECKMFMSGYDLGRLPDGFEDEINSLIYERGAVQISDASVDIENGFILKYDNFEVNCTLKAVFDESMDHLKDTLSKELFI